MTEENFYPQEAIDHALAWSDLQKDGPPGFWNDLRALAWAYRLAKSEQERFEKLFHSETEMCSRQINKTMELKAEIERLMKEAEIMKQGLMDIKNTVDDLGSDSWIRLDEIREVVSKNPVGVNILLRAYADIPWLLGEIDRLTKESEAKDRVVKAAKKYYDGCGKFDHDCGYCILNDELFEALAALKSHEISKTQEAGE